MYSTNHGNALLPRPDSGGLNILLVAPRASARAIEEVLKGAVILEAERFDDRDHFNSVCVERLEGAQRELARRSYDVILVDMNQADAAKHDILQWAAGFAAELPVLLLSQTADATLSQLAISAGIQACLHRDGLDLQQLPEIVLRSIDNHALIAFSEAAVVH